MPIYGLSCAAVGCSGVLSPGLAHIDLHPLQDSGAVDVSVVHATDPILTVGCPELKRCWTSHTSLSD
eukprot:2361880-Amphidinium_carterae.1